MTARGKEAGEKAERRKQELQSDERMSRHRKSDSLDEEALFNDLEYASLERGMHFVRGNEPHYAEGVESTSPGLRGTSYPGSTPKRGQP